MTAKATINEEILAELKSLGGDDEPEFFQEFIDIFNTRANVLMDDIEAHFKAGEYKDLRAKAHAMSGSSGQMGAAEIQRLAKEIETAPDDNVLKEKHEEYVTALRSELALVLDYFAKM